MANNQKNSEAIWIGLMSGTSVDAIDAVALRIPNDGKPALVHSITHAWPLDLQAILREAPLRPPQTWTKYLELDRRVAEEHATAVLTLRKQLAKECAIAAVGFHGQTLFHAPQQSNSLQLGSPAHLAAQCRLPVIADFRRADLARGGQGAPLAPLFHSALWSQDGARIGVLNLGGIANLSILNGSQIVAGFDTGPANGLMDAWCQGRFQCDFDRGGQIAQQGNVIPELLRNLLAEPYFAEKAPKSTGRESFSLPWLHKHLTEQHDDRDVLRSLLELTVRTITDSTRAYAIEQLVLVGGGAANHFLVSRLRQELPAIDIHLSSDFGWPTNTIEAALFAWLAERHCQRQPVNCPPITGAYDRAVLGAYYPA